MISSAGSSTSRQKKKYVWAAVALIVGIIILLFLFLRHPKNIASPTPPTGNPIQSRISQTTSHIGNTQIAPEEKTYSASKDQPRPADLQTHRNAGNSSRPYVANPIRSIALSTMFTYETENGTAFPQDAVPFVPPEDAHAYLESPDGNVRLDFVSVRFVKQDDLHVIVINSFFLQRSSDLYGSPVETLTNFDFISMPIITAGYESSLKTIVNLKWSLEVNGRHNLGWGYYGSDSVLALQDGPTFRVPLGELAKKQFERK